MTFYQKSEVTNPNDDDYIAGREKGDKGDEGMLSTMHSIKGTAKNRGKGKKYMIEEIEAPDSETRPKKKTKDSTAPMKTLREDGKTLGDGMKGRKLKAGVLLQDTVNAMQSGVQEGGNSVAHTDQSDEPKQ